MGRVARVGKGSDSGLPGSNPSSAMAFCVLQPGLPHGLTVLQEQALAPTMPVRNICAVLTECLPYAMLGIQHNRLEDLLGSTADSRHKNER